MTTVAPVIKTIDIPIVTPKRVPKGLPEAVPAPLIIVPIRQPERVEVKV